MADSGNSSGEKKTGAKKNDFSAAALFMQLGVSMCACVLIGIIGGIFLDRRFGTGPWLMFLGCLLGPAASFKVMFDLTTKYRKSGGGKSND